MNNFRATSSLEIASQAMRDFLNEGDANSKEYTIGECMIYFEENPNHIRPALDCFASKEFDREQR